MKIKNNLHSWVDCVGLGCPAFYATIDLNDVKFKIKKRPSRLKSQRYYNNRIKELNRELKSIKKSIEYVERRGITPKLSVRGSTSKEVISTLKHQGYDVVETSNGWWRGDCYIISWGFV